MPTTTARLGLTKPLGTENVTRQQFNDNWDTLDAEVATEAELTTHKTAATLDHPDGSVTDVKIGNRTITDTVVAATGAATLTSLLSKLGYMLKAITGKAAWYTAPAITLEATNTKFGATGTGHAHTGATGDGAKIAATGLAAGAADDTAIGTRTIIDTTVAAVAAAAPTSLFSQLGYMIKGITGKATWYTLPAITLEALNTLIVSVAAANKLLKLDSTGKLPASITGAAATAAKLTTGRTINGVTFDGSANITLSASGGKQLFTATGTFVVPPLVTMAYISLCGGGANGVHGNASVYGGGGGAGATKLAYKVMGLTPGASIAVTVGGIGGTSSFGAYVSCPGGGAGSASTGGISGGEGGTDGGYGAVYKCGDGGSGIFGSGGSGGGSGTSPATNGSGYGAGGGGTWNAAAGSGTPGMVLVEW